LRSRALAEAKIATQNSPIRIAEKCGSREIRQRQGPHQRLSQLSNRIDGEEQAKIMGAVHARIPMVIPDELRALQLEKAEEVEWEWSALRGMVQERLAGHKELQVTIDREITQDEIAATDLGSNVARARDRIARLRRARTLPGSTSR
jgi:hypothetical protein